MQEKAFELSRVSGQPVSDAELLEDLRRVASNLGKTTVAQKEYRLVGLYDDSTATRRFGSWNEALKAAGLSISNVLDIGDEDLYENILTLWQHYGRQPRRRELALQPSRISQSPYLRRFQTWNAALESFVSYGNANDSGDLQTTDFSLPSKGARRTSRDPSHRLRFQVLQRDRFACCSCGASPATKAGVELHVDHVTPWSKGGETTLANLQTLCSKCNLGKGAYGEGEG
ncbi:HNH endonuclease [Cyanobium sp. Candia 9D4]|nr:HNH endonuclease [Cyanobium sp. Candia 9D4]